jgi:uncharacterized protein (TIGR03437 family)
MKMKFSLRLIFAFAITAFGQNSLDSSGNQRLQGTFVFRHVVLNRFDGGGKVIGARAESGQIEFDGAGHYRMTGSFIDSSSATSPQGFSVSDGAYSIGSSGFGFLADPGSPQDSRRNIYGAFAQDVFTGSATENGSTIDFFAAIRVGDSTSLSRWRGDYWIGSIDFRGGREDVLKNARFRVTADGNGGITDFSVSGRSKNRTPQFFTETIRDARYSPGNDGFSVLFPMPAGQSADDALLSQDVQIMISPDGAFLLGYSPLGYDVFMGIRALAQPASQTIFQGTYFLTALEDQIHGDGASSFYGSEFDARGSGNEIRHQRVGSNRFQAFDYIYDNHTTIAADGTTIDFNGYRIAFGNGGHSFIATHDGAFSLLIGNRSSESPPSGRVAISPIGILNAASFAPVTVPIAPGELISIFGSGLAPAQEVMAGGRALPTRIQGVQVLINGIPSPLFAVSPTQIAAMVPFGLKTEGRPVATIQVDNNGTLSNVVTMFVTSMMPGFFTADQDGLGFALAVHSNGATVTSENPAQAGEYLSMYMTGLGAVTPIVDSGAVADPKSLSRADLYITNELHAFSIQPTAIFNSSEVTYAGLAPGFAGLYQLNARVPLRAGPGDQVHLEINGDRVIVRQRWVPVAASPTNSSDALH